MANAPQTPAPRRFWPLDFIASLALAVGTFLAARVLTRALGWPVGLFVLIVGGCLAYFYFKAAWGALQAGRAERRS